MADNVLPLRQLALTLALVVAVAGIAAGVVLAPSGFAARSSVAVAENAGVGSNNAYSTAAFDATDKARRHHDRAALRGNACLKRKALAQARKMARTGVVAHQALGPIQRDCEVGYVGENVAYGYLTGYALVFDGWMRSEGHRANILSRDHRLMGLAAVKDDDGRWWSAQLFGAR